MLSGAKYHSVFGVVDDVARLWCIGKLGGGWGYSGVTELWAIDWEIKEQRVVSVGILYVSIRTV